MGHAKAPSTYDLRKNDAAGNINDYQDDFDITAYMAPYVGDKIMFVCMMN